MACNKSQVTYSFEHSQDLKDALRVFDCEEVTELPEPMIYTGPNCRCGKPIPNKEVPEEIEHSRKVTAYHQTKMINEMTDAMTKGISDMIIEILASKGEI